MPHAPAPAKTCRVIVCPPFAEPEVQSWPGGGPDGVCPFLDEVIPGGYDYAWVYRGDGASVCVFYTAGGKRRLPGNRWGLAGPLVVMKVGPGGAEADLTDDELALYRDALGQPNWLTRTRPDLAGVKLQT